MKLGSFCVWVITGLPVAPVWRVVEAYSFHTQLEVGAFAHACGRVTITLTVVLSTRVTATSPSATTWALDAVPFGPVADDVWKAYVVILVALIDDVWLDAPFMIVVVVPVVYDPAA